MANLAKIMLTILLLVVAAQSQRKLMTIKPITIKEKGGEMCPSPEQQISAKQHLARRIHLMLLPNFFTIDQCGDGLWYKLVSINMSDPLSQCPQGWAEENIGGVRGCGRGTASAGCQSTFLSSDDIQYTKICGKAIGYQYGHTDAFAGLHGNIDQVYVDGLSITHGTPRQHLWTYAAAVRDGPSTYTGKGPSRGIL